MPTIQVEVVLSTDKLLEAVKQLSQAELEKFVSQVLAIQAQRSAPSLSAGITPVQPLIESLDLFSDDFMADREQPDSQERK